MADDPANQMLTLITRLEGGQDQGQDTHGLHQTTQTCLTGYHRRHQQAEKIGMSPSVFFGGAVVLWLTHYTFYYKINKILCVR